MRANLFKRIGALILSVAMIANLLTVMAAGVEPDWENTDAVIVENGAGIESPESGGEASEPDAAEPVDADSVEELEAALNRKAPRIRITGDFEIDRTLFVTAETLIYSEEKHTLTRGADFGGDLFVVGVTSGGESAVSEETPVKLVLGDPGSAQTELLVIDGNRDNMRTDVVGTVIFLVYGAEAALYDNISVVNAYKTGNERTLDKALSISSGKEIGGAVAIVADGTLRIFGGSYRNNAVSLSLAEEGADDVSSRGGVIYNVGKLYISGGTFEQNAAYVGGVVYASRKSTTEIENAQFKSNTATTEGGAVYITLESKAVIEGAAFEDNKADVSGGAVSVHSCYLDISNTEFKKNEAAKNGGAVYVSYVGDSAINAIVTIAGSAFNGNISGNYGGAIYATKHAVEADVLGLTVRGTNFSNNLAQVKGGAIYLTGGSDAYLYDTEFVSNATGTENTSDNNGGAIYTTGAQLVMDTATFTNNQAGYNGGVLGAYSGSDITLNNITAQGNTAGNNAGVLYNSGSVVRIYASTLSGNSAKSNGGALSLHSNGATYVYNTTFRENAAVGNGGAVYVYTGASQTLLNGCTFERNSADNYGGVSYASEASLVEFYDTTATNNSAGKGGVFYITTTATEATVAGLIVSGNTATSGGPIIWGNTTKAKLNINKTLYRDMAVTGELDAAYWAEAIANKLTVTEVDVEIPAQDTYVSREEEPGEPEEPTVPTEPEEPTVPTEPEEPTAPTEPEEPTVPTEPTDPPVWDGTLDGTLAVEAASVEALEAALNANEALIRITADFEIDRTLYVTSKTIIYSSEKHTLTRAASFGGDMFVVCGGTGVSAKLVLGDSGSVLSNMLIIDGNKDAMTTNVVGSIFFVANGADVELYENITVMNAHKVGNERTLDSTHSLLAAENIGGAVAIVAGGTLRIFGGFYRNNSVTLGLTEDGEENVSSRGGVIYSVGNLYISGGTFEGNAAAIGGAVYTSYESNLEIENALFKNNTATEEGGAVYITLESKATIKETVLEANEVTGTSGNGGAVSVHSSHLTVRDTGFKQNKAAKNGGALYVSYVGTSDINAIVTIAGSEFDGNIAENYGGAVYATKHEVADDVLGLTVRETVFRNNHATEKGGALYLTSGADAYLYDTELTDNATDAVSEDSYNGGAIYTSGSELVMDKATFKNNQAGYNGGALGIYSDSQITLNNITAENNTAGNNAGFLYNSGSTLHMYGSTLSGNSAIKNGGALSLHSSGVTDIYNTVFRSNSAGGNGGAVYVYTGATNTLLNGCTFEQNDASGYGGVAYASNASIVELYDTVATANSAGNGGVFYITTTDTEVTISGLTVSGNTASVGGPVIWGNTTKAKLYLNKALYTDKDTTAALDDDYWAAAIVNKLTTIEVDVAIPEQDIYISREDVPGEGGDPSEPGDDPTEPEEPPVWDGTLDDTLAVEVDSVEALEAALNAQSSLIRITADFEIDRTLYVTAETVIYSTERHVLTRGADFGGDLFVVGENADGKSSISAGGPAKLVLGDSGSVLNNMLIIDGNKDNMRTDVVGTVIFISYGATVELHKNISVINVHKNGNERTLNSAYTLNYPETIGGAVAIVASGSLRVFGGTYRDNSVNQEKNELGEDGVSTKGGVFYNVGNLYIYDGNFENNKSGKGGVVFNYRKAYVYGGSFVNNYAALNGGVFCMANSQYCEVSIGYGAKQEDQILFASNTAGNNGGVIYASSQAVISIYGNTVFKENRAVTGSGGAINTYGLATVTNAIFENNISCTRGGAVYLSISDAVLTRRISEFTGVTFIGNESTRGGAVSLFSGDSSYAFGAHAVFNNCTFLSNAAKDHSADGSGTTICGGAIYLSRKSEIEVKNTLFKGNTATNEGGAIYITEESVASIDGSRFEANKVPVSGGNGGALSVHSGYLTIGDTVFTQNTAKKNGGALYVSYVGDSSINAIVTITGTQFDTNACDNYGGAIYVTKHTVAEDVLGLTVKESEFTGNKAAVKGGAMYLTSGADAYLYDTEFVSNATGTGSGSDNNGGAIYTSDSELVMDKATFKNNQAGYNGGALGMYTSSKVTLNNITAEENTAKKQGGFLYNSGSTLNVYGSVLANNSANEHGGAISLRSEGVSNVYNTTFKGNTATECGGAVYVYTGASNSLFNGCTFEQNNAGTYGGAVYASNASTAELYNTTATGNSAAKGGAMYITTTNTEVTVAGLTVSGNTAGDGPIIFGNTTKAKLNLNKALYTDKDVTEALDETYWTAAIANELTVTEVDTAIPDPDSYTSQEKEEEPEKEKEPVSVQHIFDLGKQSSNAAINGVYGSLEKLDNSSNFMSRNTTVFENINNSTVTLDTFVYHEGEKAHNGNFAEGLLIYQAMLYKQAHPEEKVSIDISSFRFSIAAAVCINRDSRYFGYMRNLHGKDYDEYGFVRISYLLVCAAKMGIEVTVIGQLDAYPTSSADPNYNGYFTSHLDDPCDPAYAEGLVSDYMNFQLCEWTSYDDKDATDMMHTKLCAVSHYLDMNGQAHRNAVWSSSANLDGVNSNGTNGNNKLQTASIVSDHAEIYRVASNYLRLIAQYCDQEGVYEFRTLANLRATEQVALLLAGRGNEIPADEQIVYVGTEDDKVFEMYFAPFGGGAAVWDEVYNPYCKYLRKMYDSEDSIIFTWNNANYNTFPLGLQMEDLIIRAFHENANPENKIYANLAEFNVKAFSDLVVGETIGVKSFNKKDFGAIHSKDVQVSYVEDGQRYYVTLLNSMNIHGGSMSYQSNFLLVVKETALTEDSVFFTVADQTTVGIVDHTYGQEYSCLPDNANEEGYTYRVCEFCGKTDITGTIHRESEWIVDREATDELPGIHHVECRVCGEILRTRSVQGNYEASIDWQKLTGQTFTSSDALSIQLPENKTPHTFEAVILVPETVSERGGIIVGNYDGTTNNTVSFEVYKGGRVRLYFVKGGNIYEHIFSTDIRSSINPVHIALTVERQNAKLYVDGVLVEETVLPAELPETVENLKIGGDSRSGNTRYFKGTIYTVSLFEDIRTQEEIQRDRTLVSSTEDALLFNTELRTFNPGNAGQTFTNKSNIFAEISEDSTPHTIEAVINVPKTMKSRAGVIIGNYDNRLDGGLNLEIYTDGRVRLFYTSQGKKIDCIFGTDIRSDEPVHIAVTVENTVAKLYVNGTQVETAALPLPLPEKIENLKIGGDNRSGNPVSFKGTIYSVALFDDVRTDDEILEDASAIKNYEGLIFIKDFYQRVAPTGMMFSSNTANNPKASLEATPHTFEMVLQIPKTISERAGVIVGNYNTEAASRINLEAYNNGQLRLFYTANGKKYSYMFKTDIRSDDPIYAAVTVSDTEAKLYINGEWKETVAISCSLPESEAPFVIGNDQRADGAQYFRGILYSMRLFSDVRTEDQIKTDGQLTYVGSDSLLYEEYYTTGVNTSAGRKFTAQSNESVVIENDRTPHTFEAIIQVPKTVTTRAGIIVGNYDKNTDNKVSFEIYEGGKVRLYFSENGVVTDHIFAQDIRSNDPVHIAVTVDGTNAKLFVNGVLSEEATLAAELPETVTNLKLGNDNRAINIRYFRGTIYSVSLFENVKTAYEIKQDMISVDEYAEGLLYHVFFGGVCSAANNSKDHVQSNWIVDSPATQTQHGQAHTECLYCGKILMVTELLAGTYTEYANRTGMSFDGENLYKLEQPLEKSPKTFEILMQLSPTFAGRAGVLVGNYDGSGANQINVEIYNGGKPRLYSKANGVAHTYSFATDIRSNAQTHLTFVIDGLTASLYVNGKLVETVTMAAEIPNVYENFCIGGDNRANNAQYFRGTIYQVSMFDDVRTAEEIAFDTIMVAPNEDGLVYSEIFTN